MKLKDFESIEAARTHTEKRPVILTANDMGVLFDKHPGTLQALESIEASNESVRIFLTLFRSGGGRYDFREKPEGVSEETDSDQLKTKMQQLVDANVVTAAFATAVFNAANPQFKPFENVSEYEWRKARDEEIDKKEVSVREGYLDITTLSPVESHRPVVYALVAGEYRYITTMGEIALPDKYSCQVPRNYTTLHVDNAYGVIE